MESTQFYEMYKSNRAADKNQTLKNDIVKKIKNIIQNNKNLISIFKLDGQEELDLAILKRIFNC